MVSSTIFEGIEMVPVGEIGNFVYLALNVDISPETGLTMKAPIVSSSVDEANWGVACSDILIEDSSLRNDGGVVTLS